MVCQPRDSGFLLEMARHGFRLMVVHPDREFLDEVRALLRREGLASLLMGAQQAESDQVPNLARGFYEAVLLCSASSLSLDDILFAVGPGGVVVKETGAEIETSGLSPLDLPAGYVGGRVP